MSQNKAPKTKSSRASKAEFDRVLNEFEKEKQGFETTSSQSMSLFTL